MTKKTLGLIAGNGKFPIVFAQEARKQGYHVVAAGVKGDTSYFLRYFVDEFQMFPVVSLRDMFRYFQKHQVRQAIMAGQVNPQNLFREGMAWDEELGDLFAAIQDRKADTIFAEIAERLKKVGIELADSTFLIRSYMAPKGTITRTAPTREQLEDIVFGQTIAKAMGGIDVGQTVVIKDKAIVAIEAMEGTDAAILRGGRIARKGAVVVKMSKPNQDLRFDVPVMGPRTIANLRKVGAACLAVEAGKTIMIDRQKCVRMANKAGICIVGC